MWPLRCWLRFAYRDTTGRGKEVRIPLSDNEIGTVANLGMLAEIFSTGANRERLGNTVYGALGVTL